jgi:hypothetical protein
VIALKQIHISLPWKELHGWKAIRVGMMNILRIVTVLWLIVHFFLVFLYVLPSTPIEEILEPFLNATIGRYFNQGWDLFAPNPINTDFALLVRPLSNDEFKAAKVKSVPNDGWYDVSSPVWGQLGQPFAAYVKFSDIITNATSSYDGNRDQESLRLLVRFASAFCKSIKLSNANYIALTIRERHSKPWPEEASKPAVVKTVFVGVFRIDKSVENSLLYQM